MLITCIQHTPLESPGCISDWARERGHGMQIVYPANGERLPEPQSIEWLVVLGGPMGVHDEYAYPWLKEEKTLIEGCLKARVTTIGICLGAQLIAHVLGAKVARNRHSELGWFPVLTTPEARGRFPLLPRSLQALCWHNDTFDIPSGAVQLGSSEACANQGFYVGDEILGLQFHLEWPHGDIKRLVENSPEEFRNSGRFTQPAHAILTQVEWAQRATGLMNGMLDALPGN